MGAYYKPVNLEDMSAIYSHDFGSGLKLMEHSWVGNTFVNAVLNEIENGTWKNKPISWICDYDDDMEDYYSNSSNLAFNNNTREDIENYNESDIIIINLDKKEFVNFGLLPIVWEDDKKWIVNPFSLLTSSTTERMGGGDYSNSHSFRGSWSGDRFIIVRDIKLVPVTFEDITIDSLFYEEINQKPSNKMKKTVIEAVLTENNKRTRKSVFKRLLKPNEVVRN